MDVPELSMSVIHESERGGRVILQHRGEPTVIGEATIAFLCGHCTERLVLGELHRVAKLLHQCQRCGSLNRCQAVEVAVKPASTARMPSTRR
jgi:hypothetical protein